MQSEKMEQTTIQAKQSAICFQIVLLSAFVFSYYPNCDFAFHVEQPQRKPFHLMSEATGSYRDKSLSVSEWKLGTCGLFSSVVREEFVPRRLIPDTDRKSSTEVMSSTASVRMRTCFSH